jgi:TatA/E family protein of Tat protein translocase
MIAIFVIALVIFGPKKLPELGRTLGKAITEFRRAKNELKNTFETHLRELERETKPQIQSGSSSPSFSQPEYSYPYDEYSPYGSNEHETASATHQIAETPTARLPEPATPAKSESTEASEPVTFAPVADTIPRSNGVQPVESARSQVHEEHPA